MDSLYEQLGGEAAVDAAVTVFYQHVINDERIKHFFVGMDMSAQREHQKRFLSYAFGGLSEYKGRSLALAHKRLVEQHGLNDSHFDAVAENLQRTLVSLDIDELLIDEVMEIVASTRNAVLNR